MNVWLRAVHNQGARVGAHSVDAFAQYVAQVHRKYVGTTTASSTTSATATTARRRRQLLAGGRSAAADDGDDGDDDASASSTSRGGAAAGDDDGDGGDDDDAATSRKRSADADDDDDTVGAGDDDAVAADTWGWDRFLDSHLGFVLEDGTRLDRLVPLLDARSIARRAHVSDDGANVGALWTGGVDGQGIELIGNFSTAWASTLDTFDFCSPDSSTRDEDFESSSPSPSPTATAKSSRKGSSSASSDGDDSSP